MSNRDHWRAVIAAELERRVEETGSYTTAADIALDALHAHLSPGHWRALLQAAPAAPAQPAHILDEGTD